jgi:virulence factor Mce-like protein
MDTTSKSTQFKAGFFVLLGIISIGALVLEFGRFGDNIKKFYTITVEYRNASGLLKGADVLLAGARIGFIADAPQVLPNMQGVSVQLNIDQKVEVPQGSVFSIGSSGLLGDRFVTVTMGENAENQKPIPPGSTITNGVSESSIAELQRQLHDEILPKLNNALDNIDSVSGTLKNQVFNEEGVKNLQATLANFKTTSATLASSSEQIKGVTDQANLLLKKGNAAMDSVNGEIKAVADHANLFLAKGTTAFDSINGAAGDLKAFVANLRQHGIIFYRDTSSADGPLKKRN